MSFRVENVSIMMFLSCELLTLRMRRGRDCTLLPAATPYVDCLSEKCLSLKKVLFFFQAMETALEVLLSSKKTYEGNCRLLS